MERVEDLIWSCMHGDPRVISIFHGCTCEDDMRLIAAYSTLRGIKGCSLYEDYVNFNGNLKEYLVHCRSFMANPKLVEN